MSFSVMSYSCRVVLDSDYLYIVWFEVPDEYTSRLITTSTSAGMPESRAF